jgi:hypothetical protein
MAAAKQFGSHPTFWPGSNTHIPVEGEENPLDNIS